MQMIDRDRAVKPSQTVLRLARDLIRVSGAEWDAAQAEAFLDQLNPSIRRYLILDMLTGAGDRMTSNPSVQRNKIQAIKLIRQYTGWGLKEAKEFVELAGREIEEAWIGGIRLTEATLPAELSTEQLNQLSQDLLNTGYQLE